MHVDTFHELRRYPTTSWAVWSENADHSVPFFLNNIESLHARSVIVGLNRSEAWPGDSVDRKPNFHTPGHTGDRRLKRHIQDAGLGNLVGSFMTDVSDEIKTDSGKVQVDPHIATQEFVAKVFRVEPTTKRTIVCLGDTAFDVLREGFNVGRKLTPMAGALKLREFKCVVRNENWQVYRVLHSGNYGIYIHKSEGELAAQLAHINDRV